ncbi:helix-turn-helix domain-containing protein [Sulfurovum sp. TSL1]|uniref:helix-turn-helix domain-containing protein n=1 Tax=Sulfurovum sp. TSL1 TaxID=2826994 RepID=UPI001CC5C159|nr:helix-turn-helix domain-containing protein [Sulfurovum sp. TSL1]GIT98820.1 hypothetical protein TSL1_16410 [Sulfurovum sp. TSL1]
MGKLIKKFKNNFTQVPNTIIKDKRLSFKAKGLYMHLVSKPDNWVYYVKEFEKSSKDGRDSIQSGLKELEKYEYLIRVRTKDTYGRFSSFDYYIYAEPLNGFSVGWKNGQSGEPSDGQSSPTNTKSTNTDLTNTDCRYENVGEFRNYIRQHFINKDILTAQDKNTNQIYIISVGPDGKLYDKKGTRFTADRSLEMWNDLFKYYLRHQLDFQKSNYVNRF